MTFSTKKLTLPLSGANSKGWERKGRQPGSSGARPRAPLGALPFAGPRAAVAYGAQRPREHWVAFWSAAAPRGARPAHPPAAGAGQHGAQRHVRLTAASAVPRAAAELPGSQRVPEPRQQELRDGGEEAVPPLRAVAARAGGAEQPWAAARRSSAAARRRGSAEPARAAG